MENFKKKVIVLIEKQWQYFYERREEMSNTCVRYEDKVVETVEDKLSHKFYRGLWSGVQDTMYCLEELKRKIEALS